ncbi:MAG: PPOX class F420-dependent oxidoreductase [Chloroflexi bacterium]|nr:PPOX class F420-dependent oxidoreductase [Chloroflexota bacterium]
MTPQIPAEYKDLIDGPVVVSLVTVMPDGQPQATPVWCNSDGDHILVNTARGRRKDKNMTANPRVTILAIDPQDPYRWMEVRGMVVESTEDGAVEHINALAKIYRGRDQYYTNPDQAARETRVTYKIQPLRVIARG